MNLSTGKKEAKLLEADEESNDSQKSSSALIQTDDGSETSKEEAETSRVSLEEALKGIPSDEFEYSEEKIKEITKKFRSYEKLKEEMSDLNMGIKTDFEIMSELFAKYQKVSSLKGHSVNDVKEILDAFQEMTHQIDNANEFILSGGIERLILPNLKNQSDVDIKISAIRLLGTIIQNNPKGQIAAFEKNAGQLLLKSLSKSSNTNELSTVIFGLGGILRKFPIAQKEILNKSGLKIFIDLLNRQVEYKVKIKCLRLLNDLIRDYNDAIINGNLEKIKQYSSADIKGRLSETDYCKTVDEVFTIHRKDFLNNLYSAEDIVNVLITSKDLCQAEWSESPIFRHTLLVIKNNYDRARDKPDEDVDKNDLENLTQSLGHLNEFLYGNIEIKDEL